MKPKGDLSWLEYYLGEIEEKKSGIAYLAECVHKDHNVSKEIGVLQNGGLLSYPHTHPDFSLDYTSMIIKALYKKDITEFTAIGVLHSASKSEKEEYSLAVFKRISEIYADANHLPRLNITEKYPPRRKRIESNESYIERLVKEGQALRNEVKKGRTVRVVTGDLVHAGKYYDHGHLTMESRKENEAMVFVCVEKALDLVYHEKRYEDFLKFSRGMGNDQAAAAIMVSEFLGENIEFEIFCRGLSNYKEILGGEAFVASVLYGVWPTF